MPEMTRRWVDSLQSDKDVVKYTISYRADGIELLSVTGAELLVVAVENVPNRPR